MTRIVRKVIIAGGFRLHPRCWPGNKISGCMDMSCNELLAHRIYMPSR